MATTTKAVRFHGWTLAKGSQVEISADLAGRDDYRTATLPNGQRVSIRVSALEIPETVVRHTDGLVCFA